MSGQELTLKIPAASMKGRAEGVLKDLTGGFLAHRRPIPIRYILQAAKIDPMDQRKGFQLVSRGAFYFSADGKQLINSGPSQLPPQAAFKQLSVVFKALLNDQTLRLAVTLPPEVRANVISQPARQGIVFSPPIEMLLYDLPAQIQISRHQYLSSVIATADDITYTLQDSLDASSANLFHLVLQLNVKPSALRQLLGVLTGIICVAFLSTVLIGCENHGDTQTPPLASFDKDQCWSDDVPDGKVIVSESYSPGFPNCADQGPNLPNVYTVEDVEATGYPLNTRDVCVDTKYLPPLNGKDWVIVAGSYTYSTTPCWGGNPTTNPPNNNTVTIKRR